MSIIYIYKLKIFFVLSFFAINRTKSRDSVQLIWLFDPFTSVASSFFSSLWASISTSDGRVCGNSAEEGSKRFFYEKTTFKVVFSLFWRIITQERRDEGCESGDYDEAQPPGTQPTLVTLLQF